MRIITSAVLAIGFIWITVSAASIRSLDLDIRNDDVPSHESRLEGGNEETEVRSFDTNQIISPRAKLDSDFKKEILDWLNKAPKGTAQFSLEPKWAAMDPAGTSTPPRCRSFGMMEKARRLGPAKGPARRLIGLPKTQKTNPVKVNYYVMLKCAPDSKPEQTIIRSTLISSGGAKPSASTVYAFFKEKVKAM